MLVLLLGVSTSYAAENLTNCQVRNAIDMTVDDGLATLTDSVSTLPERQAATENALEGNASIVDNDLIVIYGPDYYKSD